MPNRKPYYCYLILFLFGVPQLLCSQVSFNANDSIGSYDHPFCYGANMGYYPGWSDINLSDIAGGNPELKVPGIGVNGMRPALFAHFLEQYGYDIRLPQFQHYESIGIDQNVIFVGYPSAAQRDKNYFCPSRQTEVFADMYTPIWDNGENGTPVNDDNDYALYLYKMVSRYKSYTKIWEIWNEPDYDQTANAWKPASFPESWWNEDPGPCDYALFAPVQYYIRMLRISWEVIKYVDPNAHIAVGGLGYPAFLEVIMRNTDNPDGGKITAEYPFNAGAYFDVLSYHAYPHIDGSLREWSNDIGGFKYDRHSDQAIKGLLEQQEEFKKVLYKWGYDDQKFPAKHWIITECNVPRKAFGDFMGSESSQVNFLIKALITCQANGIHQFHVYNLGESNTYEKATSEYQLMGMYQQLVGTKPYEQVVNNGGIAYKTCSELIGPFAFDQAATEELNLPANIDGAAFRSSKGKLRLVLWAKTSFDQSEEAKATYTLPTSWNYSKANTFQWDFSKTGAIKSLPNTQINLTGSPLFIDPI